MRNTVRDLYLLIGLAVATAGLVVAQNTEEPARPPAEEPADEPASDDTDAAGTDADDVFIPTEEVLADEEITFPVDI